MSGPTLDHPQPVDISVRSENDIRRLIHMMKLTRREILEKSPRLAGAVAMGLPLAAPVLAEEPSTAQRKLKVVAVGGHVDDPQGGCGGAMALHAEQGHEVVALSLTHGDSEPIAGQLGISNKELAARRSADAIKSCALLKARMIFMDQIDLHTEITPARYQEFSRTMLAEKPDIVFTHWPIDTHPDHRVASLLTYNTWLDAGLKFELYYYEVETGRQTQHFFPNHYVDITPVEARKREACFTNGATIEGWWGLHEAMQRFRGMEYGCKAAEGFVHMSSRLICPPPFWQHGCRYAEE
ncbi:MAG: PIG-L family deacetylase [Chloroflexi bacterium]|nr:MAG: PIG-L family deacetylase [Chloroflexota bacterium]